MINQTALKAGASPRGASSTHKVKPVAPKTNLPPSTKKKKEKGIHLYLGNKKKGLYVYDLIFVYS